MCMLHVKNSTLGLLVQVRDAMGIDVKGAILIFDEAHNIEDVAR